MNRRLLIALAALMLAVVACSGNGGDPTDPQSTSSATSPSDTEPTTSQPTTSDAVTSSTSGTATTTSITTQPPTTTMPPATTTSPPSTTLGAPNPVAIDVTVSDGEVSGPGRVQVPRGASIRLTVTSDEADEVHFHGYDIFADVAPGQPAIMLVDATIPGVFEVELEGAGLELVLIEVA